MKKAVLSSVFLLGALAPFAASADTQNGDTIIGFEAPTIINPTNPTGPGLPGEVKFKAVPSFDFGSKNELNGSGYTLNAQGVESLASKKPQGFVVEDTRGGNNGYRITANVSLLKNASGNTLPVQSFTMETAEKSIPDPSGTGDIKTHVAIPAVSVYNTTAEVVKTTTETGGTLESAVPSVSIIVGNANVKAGDYKGTIVYTLLDSNVSTTTPTP